MNKKKIVALFLLLIGISGVLQAQKNTEVDVQGHRGYRGYYPENTIYGFTKAIELGVQTIELDVVVSKDKKVVVSHDPYLSSAICLGPNGEKIKASKEKSYKLYEMDYQLIKQCDCGSKGNNSFPLQQQFFAYKPTLDETFSRLEYLIEENDFQKVNYNIEIKSSIKGDGVMHPFPEEFVALVVALIDEYELQDRAYIQSFDTRILEIIHQEYPHIKTSLLVGFSLNAKTNLEALTFKPDYLSPNFRLVNEELVNYCKTEGIQLVPWTVNDEVDIVNMIDLGVDGIISDFPERVMTLLKQ